MGKPSYFNEMARKIDKYLVKYGDSSGKIALHFLLWNIGHLFSFFRLPMRPKKDATVRVAFILKGGVGDLLVALNFVQNFDRYLTEHSPGEHTPADHSCGGHTIDLGVPTKRGLLANVQILGREQPFLRQIVPPKKLRHDYDLVIEIVRFPLVVYFNKKKIKTLAPALAAWVETVEEFRRENPLLYRHGTPGDYLGARMTLLRGANRLSQADIGGKIGVESVFRPVLPSSPDETIKKFRLASTPFITLQRGVGGGNRNVSTKLWPAEHYERFVALFKRRFPEIRVVQLGTKKNPPISGVDLDLRGETSFEEVMVLIAETRCHLDGECGMVHLRHFLTGKPSVVLFGPTDERFYGYPENANLRSDACPGGCEWITCLYTQKCPRGCSENECLTKLTPEAVLDAVEKIITPDEPPNQA